MTSGGAPNHWSDFEYSPLKLLLASRDTDFLLSIANDGVAPESPNSLPAPRSIELHLTDVCNLECSWCTDRRLRKRGAEADVNGVRRLLDDCARLGMGVTVEGGGEPTLHSEFQSLVRHAADRGLHLGLITNGVVDVSEVARCFRWIRVSLDATTPDAYLASKSRDHFDLVLANLERIGRCRHPEETHLGVGFVLTRSNSDSAQTILDRLDGRDVDYVYLRPVEGTEIEGPTTRQLSKLDARLRQAATGRRIKPLLRTRATCGANNAGMPCIAHLLSCVVHANGDLVICEKRAHDRLVLGNLWNRGFEDLWWSDQHLDVLGQLLDPDQQRGCELCRMTPYNRILTSLPRLRTTRFI